VRYLLRPMISAERLRPDGRAWYRFRKPESADRFAPESTRVRSLAQSGFDASWMIPITWPIKPFGALAAANVCSRPMPKQRFVPEILDVTSDARLGKQLAKTFKKGATRDAILKLLGDRIEASRIPSWISWSTGASLDSVGHLGEPMFCATVADEDEFYGEPVSELVLGKSGGGQRLVEGEEAAYPKLTDADVAKLTAYDGEGYLLAGLIWAGRPPKLKDARKLLAGAFDASGGDLTAYERAEATPAKAPTSTTAPAVTTAAYLGDLGRSGRFEAPAPRKAPKLMWTSMFDSNGGSEYGGSPVVDESLGLIFAGDGGFSAKYSATKIRDGKIAWKIELTKNQSWLVGDALVCGGVLYQATNKNLFALDPKSGKQKWVANVSGAHGSPLVVGDVVIIGSGDGLLALSLDKGRKQWLFKVKRDDVKVGVRSGAAFADGTLYFNAEDKLFAIDAATQKKKWTAPSCSRAMPTVDEASVYTWTDGGLTAIDRATGKPRWTAKSKDLYRDWSKSIAIAGDRVVARIEGKLAAFDKAKGRRLWSVGMTKPYTIGGASPIVAGDVVVCILVDDDSENPMLHAVDLVSGKVLWTRDKFPLRKTESAPLSYYCTPGVGSDGTVFVQAYGLHALR